MILTCLQTMISMNQKHSEIMNIWSEPTQKKAVAAYCQLSHWKKRKRTKIQGDSAMASIENPNQVEKAGQK